MVLTMVLIMSKRKSAISDGCITVEMVTVGVRVKVMAVTTTTTKDM